jgi:hypothetical protein
MFSMLGGLNLTLRFALELAALGALGLWGWHAAGPALGLLLPLAAAALWGLFAAPKATIAAPDAIRLGAQVLVLGGAALALAAARTPAAGAVFAAVVVLNTVLIALLPDPFGA